MTEQPPPRAAAPHPEPWSLTVGRYGGLRNRRPVLPTGVALRMGAARWDGK